MTVAFLLLEADADLDEKDSNDESALHLAITYKRSLDVMHAFFDAGCNFYQMNRLGLTTLHIRVDKNCNEAIRSLLSRGADIHKTDMEGRTALQLATLRGNVTAVLALQAEVDG